MKIPEIFFDRKTVKLLRYIKRHPYDRLSDIQKKFGESADSTLIINLCLADYLIAIKNDGTYTNFKDGNFVLFSDETFWISPKGKQVLDDRFDRLWQWSIPTIISVAALIISIFK